MDLVLFDVNETLFPLDPIADRMADVGLEGQLELWFAWVLRDGIAAAAAGRPAVFRELAEHHLGVLVARTGRDATDDDLAHVLGGFQAVVPHPDVEQGLRLLADAGVPAVTLTNGASAIAASFLERTGLRELVDELLDVTIADVWKPASAPYQQALLHRGVDPAAAALVAVHPWDVQGAMAAGITGAWIDRAGAAYPPGFPTPDVQAQDLPAVVRQLLDR